MRQPFRSSLEFNRLVQGAGDVDLARIMLEIASDFSQGLDIAACLARLEELSRRVRERCKSLSPVKRVLEQVNWVLYVEEGFSGNSEDYHDPRNSYLNEVIARRKGIPITLATVYQRVAAGVGQPLVGVNLPAHYMLRVNEGEAPIFIDAFHEGRIHDRESCARRISELVGRRIELSDDMISPCAPSRVIARMLRNLKAIHARDGDLAAGLVVQRRLAAVATDAPEESRDHALLALRLDRHAEAIAPLEHYLAVRPDVPEAEELERLLRSARREASRWN